MPSVIQKQTIIGSNLTLTEDGYEDTAIFFVTGLDAPGAQKKKQAIETVGIPGIRDPHPFIGGIIVRSIPRVTVHKGGFTASVEVYYAKPSEEDGGGGGSGPDGSNPPGTVRLGAVYERVPSNRSTDVDGKPGPLINVGYNPDAAFSDQGQFGSYSPEGDANGGNTQVGEVNAYVPRVTVIVRGNAVKCPLVKAQKTGFTNADDFLAPIAGLFDEPPDATPDTWLLIRCGSNSTDNNASFDYEWEWAYKKETWHEIAVFIDPATGRPPGNITAPQNIQPGEQGNGTIVVRVAGQTQFAPYINLI